VVTVLVRSARRDEAAELTGLVLRSKAHWGYPADFLAACREELTLSADACGSGSVRVAERPGGRLVGVSQVVGAGPRAELALLYVDPDLIGHGVGRLLAEDAARRARGRGVDELVIDADPHAESFYLRLGAVRTSTVPSGSVPGRTLPQLPWRLETLGPLGG
jgi:GNAT superfamily N-acetyltransferase